MYPDKSYFSLHDVCFKCIVRNLLQTLLLFNIDYQQVLGILEDLGHLLALGLQVCLLHPGGANGNRKIRL